MMDEWLAQIMDPASEGDFFHFLGREVESARDHPGIMPAMLAMSCRVLLPQFGRARQGFDGLLDRLLVRIPFASAQLAQRVDQFFQVLRAVVLALQESFDITENKLSLDGEAFAKRIRIGDMVSSTVLGDVHARIR